MKKILILILLLPFYSCSAPGPLFKPPPSCILNPTLITLYRPDRPCLFTRELKLRFNKRRDIVLQNNGYIHIYIKPGLHIINALEFADVPALEAVVNAKQGKNYFIKYDIKCNNQGSPGVGVLFHEVDREKAMKELPETRLAIQPEENY